ncbi:MAG: antitoxin FitA [Frankiaceae bacterium]|nr:antitoxin FitA [Frankiaceae bacterium]
MQGLWLRCSYYAGMPAITIRNVPDDVRDALASRAARSGRSLQEYLAAELAELARRPDVAEAIAAARSRARTSARVIDPDEIVADRDRERR